MNPVLGLLLRAPLHGLGLLVALLPRPVELAVGRALGRLALLARFKRRIVEENMRRCLPRLPADERARLLRENYEHYGILTLEIAHMLAPIPGHWRRYAARVTVIDGRENWEKAAARGKGVLFASGHFANWELMAAYGGLTGIANVMVTRRLKPEWLMRWMESVRGSCGTTCVLQPRTLPGILKALRAGHAVGFVLDQYMNPPMGEPMLFFGATVNTLAALAPLARRTGAAVIPSYQRRDERGVVHCVFFPEYALPDDDRAANQALVTRVEGFIREQPAQWLWAHRRFKNAAWPDPLEEREDRRSQPA